MLTLLHSTPILRVNLQSIFHLHQKLEREVLMCFTAFHEHLERTKPPGVEVITSDMANNNFFWMQSQYFKETHGVPGIVDSKPMKELIPIINGFVFNYLDFLNSTEAQSLSQIDLQPEMNLKGKKLPWIWNYFWSTVLCDGGAHLKHTHRNCCMSGVYYISMPSPASPIIFHDSRNQDPKNLLGPPFHRSFSIYPEQGDLLLFPGWLIHEVPAQPTSQPRVSIAFNYVGKWTYTPTIEYST